MSEIIVLTQMRNLSEPIAPIPPAQWPRMARILLRQDGWAGPMLMVSGFGVLLSLQFAARALQLPVDRLLLLTWLSWGIVGVIASFRAVWRASRRLNRLGFKSIVRARWWFELASMLCILSIMACLAAMDLFFGQLGQQAPGLAGTMLIVGGCGLLAFLILATVGYLLACLRVRGFRGRAFECVHFFYTNIGGVLLLGLAASHSPAPTIGQAVMTVAIGCSGIALLFAGFVTNILRWEQRQFRRSG